MSPRIHALLRAPHMVGLAQTPGIETASLAEIEALEPFMAFCTRLRIEAPNVADIRAFLTLSVPPLPSERGDIGGWRDTWLPKLDALQRALHRLQLGDGLVEAIGRARDERLHRATYRSHNHGVRRLYQRSVSVAVEELPEGWQETLRRLRREQTYSVSVLDRMDRRLGMFAWSASEAGLPVDLENGEAERALYDDLLHRSSLRAIKNGEDPSAAQPRWAYLRSTAEELQRFARHHGASEELWRRLDRNYRGFGALERQQTPLKMYAALKAPTAPVTLASARQQLEDAMSTSNPAHRHQRRLKACALGITVICPPRARDVVDRMFWGNGVHYDPCGDRYFFDFKQSKTDIPLKVGFEPSFTPFFEALLLGDNDRRYLPLIRAQAVKERRPIFVRYEGEPVAYGWFGRVWEEAVGSSSHLARTLLQTFLADLGEPGLAYGQRALGHRGDRMIERYRDDKARQKSACLAADAMAARATDLSTTDILDLI